MIHSVVSLFHEPWTTHHSFNLVSPLRLVSATLQKLDKRHMTKWRARHNPTEANTLSYLEQVRTGTVFCHLGQCMHNLAVRTSNITFEHYSNHFKPVDHSLQPTVILPPCPERRFLPSQSGALPFWWTTSSVGQSRRVCPTMLGGPSCNLPPVGTIFDTF